MLQDPKSGDLGPVGIGAQSTTPVGMKTHIEYPDILFWKYNCPYHIEMGTYVSSIYYEQVALLHPPNRLASDETEEFLPKHVPRF